MIIFSSVQPSRNFDGENSVWFTALQHTQVPTFSPSAYCMLKWSWPSLRGINNSTDLLVMVEHSWWDLLVFFFMWSCIVTKWSTVDGVVGDDLNVYSTSFREWGRRHSATERKDDLHEVSYRHKNTPHTSDNNLIMTQWYLPMSSMTTNISMATWTTNSFHLS